MERVFRFVHGPLSTTSHPLAARWSISYSIRRDIRGVYNPTDILAYHFFEELNQLHNDPLRRNCSYEYMLKVTYAIFSQPGRYEKLVNELYPETINRSYYDDLFRATFLDESHRFNADDYKKLEYRAIIYFLWIILKIPRARFAARFILESYIQLLFMSDTAVTIWLEAAGIADSIEPALGYYGTRLTPVRAGFGRRFLGFVPNVAFECRPVPLRDFTTGAVRWDEIPPSSIWPRLATLQLDQSWLQERGEQLDLWLARMIQHQESVGIFRAF